LGSTTHKSGGVHQLFHLLVDRREVSALFYPAKQIVTANRISDTYSFELLDLGPDPIQASILRYNFEEEKINKTYSKIILKKIVLGLHSTNYIYLTF
jgi:hypothetical protein